MHLDFPVVNSLKCTHTVLVFFPNFKLFILYWVRGWCFPGGSDSEKYLPAMQKTQVQSLGQKDSLEKGVATHSSILAWRIPWKEELGGLQSLGSQRVGRE